jgi:hypothetical protein
MVLQLRVLLFPIVSRGSAVGIATAYWLDDRGGLCSSQNFLFTISSRPTQPPIQWVPGALSPGVKRQRREADHWPPAIRDAPLRWLEASIPCPCNSFQHVITTYQSYETNQWHVSLVWRNSTKCPLCYLGLWFPVEFTVWKKLLKPRGS